ncbi:putative xylosidase/arabinosidase [Talaromyces proteolyticus]|uniref:Xylosidase/arabinosidase n=1 Tax=Talaromyces proteolyticus TaxID=1131652 RepID=A0AAD4KST3_9EURO|nr:putative xylosidase/arabinosidase [Talaromyces proteolyticus]KAH8696225.1 putative xylosidase/arabinosidase [Talaromyces proteolyticus]
MMAFSTCTASTDPSPSSSFIAKASKALLIALCFNYSVATAKPFDFDSLNFWSSSPPADIKPTINNVTYSGNPIFPGWYADPDPRIFEGQYWIYPSLSLDYDKQTSFDAFSSPDLVNWTRHARILDFANVTWSTNRAAWAPTVTEKHGVYYMYFSAGDGAGIGVAVSRTGPAGPFIDALDEPLIPDVEMGAEPIDPDVFIDDDGRAYLLWGGWSHGLGAELSWDMISLKAQPVELTPPNYVEAPYMIKRNGTYYYMYSVGGWGDNSYGVEYVTSTTSPLGPFTTAATHILFPDAKIAQGTGSSGVLNIPGTDDWYIVYHRRPLDDTAANDRYVCIDKMEFNPDGSIKRINITNEGAPYTPLVAF